MSAPEFSRPVRVDTIGEAPRHLQVEAEEVERINLARRFGLVAIDRLAAELALSRKGEEVAMDGSLSAKVVQACVATGEPLEAAVEAPFAPPLPAPAPTRPVPTRRSSSARRSWTWSSTRARRSTSARPSPRRCLLNLDPYPRAPGADAALKRGGGEERGGSGPVRRARGAQGQAEGS